MRRSTKPAQPTRPGAGLRQLTAVDWHAAKERYEAALRDGEDPEDLAGLGEALFWIGDIVRAVELRERAYVLFQERGDAAAAARMALWISQQYGGGLGTPAVANGWLSRAERLVRELGDSPERGWLLLRQSRRAAEPAAAQRLAQQAQALARSIGDVALELSALSQLGRALLAAGRVDQGFACLDEAMAAATCGELRDAYAIGDVCCDMIGACDRTMEFERAKQWCRVTEDFARRTKFVPIFAFCRATYAGVLLSIGRWPEAEGQIFEALKSYEASFQVQRFVAVAKLAELRLLQGRDAEAEELLADEAQRPTLARVVAMWQLARGDAPAAVRVLRRRAAEVEGDLLVAAPLLSLLVEAHLATGELDQADAAARSLGKIAAKTGTTAFKAGAAYAGGAVAFSKKDAGAVDRYEEAISGYDAMGMPLPAARARLALARCLAKRDEPAARAACRAAVATFERLGARRDLDGAAELRRRLGVGARVGPRVSSLLTRREEEVLALLALGLSNPQIGKRLFISPKTVEHHVGHILDKLDLPTRAAAAAYAVRKRPEKPAAK
jgi:DNA-binding NarL/FixJ family response regulator